MNKIIEQKIQKSPESCGVYKFFDQNNKIIYIGKASNLKKRLRSYLNSNNYKNSNLNKEARNLTYEITHNEAEALILESRLIKKYEPKFNVLLKDSSSYFFVEINNDIFPKIFIVRQKKNPMSLYIGPFTNGTILRNILVALRKIFPYCTCKRIHKGSCFNAKINLCPGYCCNNTISFTNYQRREYLKNIKNIQNILEGNIEKIKHTFEQEIKKLVAREEFEQAAKIRDTILALDNIFEHKTIVSHNIGNVHNNFLILKQNEILQSLKKIFGLSNIPHRIEMYDISNISGDYAVGSMIVYHNNKFDKNEYRRFKIRYTNETPNDPLMLKEVLLRRSKQKWEPPDILLVDGGKAQFNVAKQIIQNNKNFKNTKIGALAKGKQNLFIDNSFKPIALKQLPLETKLFLMSLQDEAHRFAVSYYHIVYRKRNLEGKVY